MQKDTGERGEGERETEHLEWGRERTDKTPPIRLSNILCSLSQSVIIISHNMVVLCGERQLLWVMTSKKQYSIRIYDSSEFVSYLFWILNVMRCIYIVYGDGVIELNNKLHLIRIVEQAKCIWKTSHKLTHTHTETQTQLAIRYFI